MTVDDFNTPFSPIHKPSRKKKQNRETLELNRITNQMDQTEIYRTFHPNTEEYIFSASGHGMFSKNGPVFEHKQFTINIVKLK